MRRTALITSILIALTTIGAHQYNAVTDYLSVPGPLLLDSTAFNLAWSSHPSPTYYKHEYIPDGETPERFNRMFLLEVVTGVISAKDALAAQVASLEQRKKSDPTINYEVRNNPETGEHLLDFIVSQSDGKEVSIVEWNAYRYVDLRKKSDRDGGLLFAYSRRAYDDDIVPFFQELKERRMKDMQKVVDYRIPGIRFVD